MAAVIGWLLTLLPIIWAIASKAMPKLIPGAIALAGRTGVIAIICTVIVKIYQFLIGIPGFFVNVFKGAGAFGAIFFAIRYILGLLLRFPVLMGFVLVMGQYFPTLLEKIFLVVGAVSIKIALIFVSWGKSFVDNMQQNNMAELQQIMGESIDSLPPCIVDIMGYMHFVEDVGMLITTAVFIGIYNLVTYFFFRYGR